MWMLLAFVISWTIFHVTNKMNKATKCANVAAKERRDGGPDVIIVGAGVGGSALAYALAKVSKMPGQFCVHAFIIGKLATLYIVCALFLFF